MYLLKSFIISIFLFSSVFSQIINYKKEAMKSHANYFEIVKTVRRQLKGLDMTVRKNQKIKKQFQRWEYFWRFRINPDGSFPSANYGYFNAGILDKHGKIITGAGDFPEKTLATWVNIGPDYVPAANTYPNYPQLGRLNCFLRFANTPNVYFVGAPVGGVWKTTDGGNTWTPVLDNVAGIGVTDIASASSSYSSNTIIYLSTGDFDGKQIGSIGVLKSTDGGNTFQSTGLSFSLFDQEVTSNLIVLNDSTVIVGTLTKIYKTTDGGNTWNVKHSGSGNNRFGRFVRNGNDIYCATDNEEILYSSDAGETWTQIKSPASSWQNVALAFDDNGVIHYLNWTGQIYKYTGSTWVTVGSPVQGYDPQGGFNQTLLFENNMIIVGGVEGNHSIDGGNTWYNSLNGYWGSSADPGTYTHSDHHAMGKLDENSATYKYWTCNDGGLSFFEYASAGSSTKPTITYKSAKCIVTQIYAVAITPTTNSDNMIIANQDNDGFSKEMHNGSLQWIAAMAGDGVACAINYNNPGTRYLGNQNGLLGYTTSGFSGNLAGTGWLTVPGVNFVWPLEINTTDPTKLYAGGDDVYLIDASNNHSLTGLNANIGQISYIATHGNTILAVGNGVAKSSNGGQNWTNINSPNVNNIYITSVDFDQNASNTLYLTSGGYSAGEKVFKSTDNGQNWTNISGNLPNVAVKKVLLYQNQNTEILFLATEIGVYYKKGNSQWTKLGGSSLPNVLVNDLDINYNEQKLIAGTFGRGVWSIDLSALVTKREELLTKTQPVIAPNPVTNGSLHISFHGNSAPNYEYILYNIVGGIVGKGTLRDAQNTIDLQHLAQGIYTIKIYNSQGEVHTEKILKQ